VVVVANRADDLKRVVAWAKSAVADNQALEVGFYRFRNTSKIKLNNCTSVIPIVT
jgi:hypothetical protein